MGDCPHWQPTIAVIIVQLLDLLTWLIISLSVSVSLLSESALCKGPFIYPKDGQKMAVVDITLHYN